MNNRITIKLIVFLALCMGIGQFATPNMVKATQNQDGTRQVTTTTTYRHSKTKGSVLAARARANASMRDLHGRQRDQHSKDRSQHSNASRQTQARDKRNQDRDQLNQDRDQKNQARETR
jgi:hypothetical protein